MCACERPETAKSTVKSFYDSFVDCFSLFATVFLPNTCKERSHRDILCDWRTKIDSSDFYQSVRRIHIYSSIAAHCIEIRCSLSLFLSLDRFFDLYLLWFSWLFNPIKWICSRSVGLDFPLLFRSLPARRTARELKWANSFLMFAHALRSNEYMPANV